jgi:hypothetical protein
LEVTHLGCAIVHQLIAGFLLMHSEVDPDRHIARGIHRLSPEPPWSPILFFYSTTPLRIQDPSHGKRFQNESF